MGKELVAHAIELLAPAGAARSRRMFGGHGLYVDDLFIAIVAADRLYLKTDGETRAAFEAAGGECFSFESRGKRQATSYWTVPAEAMDGEPGRAKRIFEAMMKMKKIDIAALEAAANETADA